MSNDHRPSSLDGIKRLAKSIKAERGLSHHDALEAAAMQAGFQSYTHARRQLTPDSGAPPPSGFPRRPGGRDLDHYAFLNLCRDAWVDTLDLFNPDHQDQLSWQGQTAIREVIERVLAHTRSHAHLPTGGGLDYSTVRRASEPGCLELEVEQGLVHVVRPKTLVLQRIERSPAQSFLLLELADLAPSGAYAPEDGVKHDRHGDWFNRREEVVELSRGEFVDRSAWDEGYLGYDREGVEIPLPDTARLVTRWFNGKVLFVTKGSLWNDTSSTYDGRHDGMTAQEVKAMIDRSLPKEPAAA